MTTIDNIMALALNYRLAGSASRDEHEEALRTALTEALAQPNIPKYPEKDISARVPVAITRDDTEHGVYYYLASEVDALMSEQPVREPLTDEQIEKLRDKTFSINNPFCPVTSKSMRKAVRAAEFAHGIGGDK